MANRQLTTFALGETFATSSNEAFLVCLTIRHAPTASLYRVVNNTADITSRGNVYTAFPFQLVLPVESGEEIGTAQLTIDNVDLLLVDMLRASTEAPRVDIEVIVASQPDVVEIAIMDLALRNVQWDASTISATLFNDDILSAGFPSQIYSPEEWQGLFG